MRMPPYRSEKAQATRDILLSALAIGSVAIGLYQLSRPSLAVRLSPLDWVDLAIVAVFWVDFIVEARRWGSLRRYVRTHWWELPSLIPAVPALVAVFPAAALLRALRLLRLFRVLGVLMRLRPAGAYVVRIARRAHLGAIFAVGAGFVLLATLAAYALESAVNPSMRTLGDSLWFVFNMFTNVAYVEHTPVTTGGRVLSAFLQLCGIAFIGIFTASLAGAIIREGPEE